MESAPIPGLVPELLVEDLDESLAFWRDLCEFTIRYDREEDRFAYLELGFAHLMLEERGHGRNWITAPLAPPLGRGINFQIAVPDAAALAQRLDAADWPLFMELETKDYVRLTDTLRVQQFLVQDPDGYLVRFQSSLAR